MTTSDDGPGPRGEESRERPRGGAPQRRARRPQDRARAALRQLARGVSAETGGPFFRSVVLNLAGATHADFALVGQLLPGKTRRVRTVALCADGEIVDDFEYALEGTPCEDVVGQKLCVYPTGVQQRFPRDKLLARMHVDGYAGTPLFDSDGDPLGLLAVLSRAPLSDPTLTRQVLRILASRASAELERERAASDLRHLIGATSTRFGEDFFRTMVLGLAGALGARHGFVSELIDAERCRLRIIALSDGTAFATPFEHGVQGGHEKSLFQKGAIVRVGDGEPLINGAAWFSGRRLETTVAAPLFDSAGNPLGLVGVMHEERLLGPARVGSILQLLAARAASELERARAEAELRRSQITNRALLDAIPDLIFRLDRCGTYLDHVPSDLLPTYVPPGSFLGRTLTDVLPEQVARRAMAHLEALFSTGEAQHFEYDLELDGQRRCYEARLARCGPDEALAICRDVTEKKRREEEQRLVQVQMLHAQKLESIGILAGGIAHDFNNLLMGVLGNAGLALLQVDAHSPVRDVLKQIETAAIRAAELTQQLLAYAGRGKLIPEPMDLSSLVQETAQLIQASISGKAVVHFELARNLPLVEADVGQIRQVVMNLMTNASDALRHGAGEIVVATGTMSASAAMLSRTAVRDKPLPGRYVFLEVRDDGVGMDGDTVQRIFDPFFTTKFAGHGLGLAAVLGIVRSHRGAILVDSEPARGTAIRVLFPETDRVATAVDSNSDGASADSPLAARILVVDDDQDVRDVTARLLESAGFAVGRVADGHSALVSLAEADTPADLLILDVTMPRMGGEEVLEQVRKSWPALPVILTSGFTGEEVAARCARHSFTAFIQKPFRREQLLRTVRRVLGAQGRPQPPGMNA